MNEENINSLVNTLGEKLSNKFKIEKVQINKSKLKVINIDIDNSDDYEIEPDINQRNFSHIEGKCTLLHVYTNERTNRKCAIIEVTSNIYKHIKDDKSRLFFRHQSCRVFDIINITPCNKCARFGHSSKKCENRATCNKCVDAHLLSKCTSTTNKCANCVYSNTEFNTKYNINHSAIYSELCEILKSKIKKYIEMSDYPMQPTYPRFFGKEIYISNERHQQGERDLQVRTRQPRKILITRDTNTNRNTRMNSSVNMIADTQNNIINRDCYFDDIDELNKCMALEKEVILNENISGLNANFNNLLVFIKCLVMKPCIIVCSETRKLVHPESFNITGYKMYYSKSNINQNYGLVVYISDYITETTEIIDINNLKLINIKITIKNNRYNIICLI